MLAVPDFRQRHHYDCGASATRSVAAFFGLGADVDFIAALGTNEDGTCVGRILDLLRSFGLIASAIVGMTLDELQGYETPVICAIQDSDHGHYVVALGVDASHVHLQDPWSGRVKMPIATFEANWHDDGYLRLGIVSARPSALPLPFCFSAALLSPPTRPSPAAQW